MMDIVSIDYSWWAQAATVFSGHPALHSGPPVQFVAAKTWLKAALALTRTPQP